MNLTSKTPRIELLLHPHQVLNLDNQPHPLAIECKNGVIWVTCTGEYQDYMLRAGKRYVPSTKGTVVIEAIDESRVEIEENK
jgi:DUF2917 family protein